MSYYDLLGIGTEADEETIQRAITQQAAQWSKRASNASSIESRHQAEKTLATIQEARQVLLKADRRAEYDASLPGARPVASTQSTPSGPLAPEDRIPCPFCREPIHREAKKCRWCNEWMDESRAKAAPTPPKPAAVQPAPGASPPARPQPARQAAASPPNIKKVSVGAMIALMICTLGLYTPYWLWTRRVRFNRELKGGVHVGNGGLIFYYTIFPLAWLNGLLAFSPDYANSDACHFFTVLGYLGGIGCLLTIFKMRKALTAHCEKVGLDAKLSGLYTFFFNVFYLQHRVNKLLESQQA